MTNVIVIVIISNCYFMTPNYNNIIFVIFIIDVCLIFAPVVLYLNFSPLVTSLIFRFIFGVGAFFVSKQLTHRYIRYDFFLLKIISIVLPKFFLLKLSGKFLNFDVNDVFLVIQYT